MNAWSRQKAEEIVRRAYLAVLRREPDSGSRGYVDQVFRERFFQDAELAASVKHPNVVEVFHVRVWDGRPYIAMELVHGQTLRQMWSRMSLRTLMHVAEQMAAAVDG